MLPVGSPVVDENLDVTHRRMEIARQGVQRVVNCFFERITEPEHRKRITRRERRSR